VRHFPHSELLTKNLEHMTVEINKHHHCFTKHILCPFTLEYNISKKNSGYENAAIKVEYHTLQD